MVPVVTWNPQTRQRNRCGYREFTYQYEYWYGDFLFYFGMGGDRRLIEAITGLPAHLGTFKSIDEAINAFKNNLKMSGKTLQEVIYNNIFGDDLWLKSLLII